MPSTFGWQSKRYQFGANRTGTVAAAVQAGLPSRLLATASYQIGTGDRLVLSARLGGSAGLVLFDRIGGQSPTVNLLDQEINLNAEAYPNVLPSVETDWALSFKIEITTDFLDPTPESPDWPFVANQNVALYLYRDIRSQSIVVRSEPVDNSLTRANQAVPAADTNYLPLAGVQTVFFFSNSPVRLRAATAVSDRVGCVRTSLPTGQYDIEFYGAGVAQSEWLQNFTIGAGDNLSPWIGGSVSGVVQAAEFNYIKSQFSTLYWPGYMIPEDFTPDRAAFRDESAANLQAIYGTSQASYANNYAIQLFGRVFAGKSYVDFVGFAVDPPPE